MSNRFRNIFYIGRLQPGHAMAEHRIDWELAKELKDSGKKRVIWSEHHRRADQKCTIECCPDCHSTASGSFSFFVSTNWGRRFCRSTFEVPFFLGDLPPRRA